MSLYTKIIDLQKLDTAWGKVKKNKPSAGVDDMTYDQFEADKRVELKQLQIELQNHTYQVLPVKLVNLYKGEKVRAIALYSMRDKVVQQSLASELTAIYDKLFTSQTYAYRNDKSAITAVEEIDNMIRSGEYDCFLKVDIEHFFDNIVWEVLRGVLSVYIKEEDVIDLIRQNSCGTSLNETSGELTDKKVGIYQGSCIAPVLSNVYLMDFDRWMTMLEVYFVRYSDDILILGKETDYLLTILQEIKLKLEALGLKINEKKSVIGRLDEGVDFLGYHFDLEGKAIPAKAETNLTDRLEMMWLTSGDIGIEDKLKKVLEIVGGWEQYYRDERSVTSIFELAALVFAKVSDTEDITRIATIRLTVENIYHDLVIYFADFWRKNRLWETELFEYEQFYRISDPIIPGDGVSAGPLLHELLRSYRQFIIREDYDLAIEIMQSYTDLRMYKKAEYWQEQSVLLKKRKDVTFETILKLNGNEDDVIFRSDSPAKMLKVFVGREDLYAGDALEERGGRRVEAELRPVTEHTVRDHLIGRLTIDTFIQRPNSTVRFMVIDIDVSKKILLQVERGSVEFDTYMQKALDCASDVRAILSRLGLNGYIEYSGCRGYHVWIFFGEWVPTRYVNMLSEILDEKIKKNDAVAVEYFPNKTRIKEGKYGQAVKVPYGIHCKTGNRSYFLDDAGDAVIDVDHMIDSIAKASLTDIKQILAAYSGSDERSIEHKEVDKDISAYGELESGIEEVLTKCNLMRYLCLKSVKTGYLTHFERLTVLYVFGHLGAEGQEFVHRVMSFTINYKRNVTEHFIRKIPGKPISCVKLRDQYKQITAESGCNCVFKRNKNCYPSPVLHAIALASDMENDMTLPTCKTLTKEKESKVKSELNTHSKVEELAAKIAELKKQKRMLDKTVAGIEKELCSIFDAQGIDCMEIEMGMLTRRKHGEKYEWVIEI